MISETLRATFRQLGTTNGLLYLLGKTLQRISRGRARIIRYHFVAQPVPVGEIAKLRPASKVVTRFISHDDPVVTQFPRPRNIINRRFKSGAECLVIESDGEFAGFLWLAYDCYDEDEVRCRYRLGCPTARAWDYDVYIAPRFRIGRSFARLWTAANAHLSGQGIHWSISRISAFNPGSLAAHRSLGIQVIGAATFICIGTLQLGVFNSAPFIHLSLSRTTIPTIDLLPPPTTRTPVY